MLQGRGRKDICFILKGAAKTGHPSCATLPHMPQAILRFAVIFLASWVIFTLLFAPKPGAEQRDAAPTGQVMIGGDEAFVAGERVLLATRVGGEEAATFQLMLEERSGGEWVRVDLNNPIKTAPAGRGTLDFLGEDPRLFGAVSRFRASARTADGADFFSEWEFAVEQPGIFRSLWRALFFRPVENILVSMLVLCGGALGLAVILVTLLVRVLLIAPNQRAIVSQKKMQTLQPELDALRKKYAKNPEVQARKMMDLWKKHGVSPLGMFWPILLQLPILIALFFVIRDGLWPENVYFLYPLPFLQGFDFLAVDSQFLWMDLRVPDMLFVLPLVVGGLQFGQLFLTQFAARRKGKGDQSANPAARAMRVMMYVLPLFVAGFTMTLPAAVGLYWGVSTLFGIGQQLVLEWRSGTFNQPAPAQKSQRKGRPKRS